MNDQRHHTAVIDDGAKIGKDVVIGPYAVIGAGVVIGDGTRVKPHAYIVGDTTIGANCTIGACAVVGEIPQDLKYKGAKSSVRIGEGTTIREHAQVHCGLDEGGETVIGDDCLLMACSHVAHDCRLGDNVILANNALLGGFVEVGDRAFVSGNAVVHQFCRIGTIAIVSGGSRISVDVPPYMMASGFNEVVGLNKVGLERAPYISDGARESIKAAYKVLYRAKLPVGEALARIEADSEGGSGNEVRALVDFCRASERGICKPGKGR